MINYAELELDNKHYDIFKDKSGVVYSVGLPTQKDLIKIGKLQFMIEELEKSYKNIAKQPKSEKDFDKIESAYKKLTEIMRNMFLFILNLNTADKEFELKDIKNIPLENIKDECAGYIDYVKEQLKN